MIFEIKHRYSGKTLYSGEGESLKAVAVKAAVEKADLGGANLRGADLRAANLGGADLRAADLSDAYLYGADLYGANLYGANLRAADLSGAYLRGANLGGADLRAANLGGANLGGADLRAANLGGADLRAANLRSADLRDAYLYGAYLYGANLRAADLEDIKTDLYQVLAITPNEVGGLLQALRDGKIDGSTYSGECACLVGTIANVRKCNYKAIEDLTPDSNRPIERWFINITPGDKPVNHAIAKITEQWILEFMMSNPELTK